MPKLWDAQVKAGLINDNAGVRFCQSIDIQEELKFNNLARENGELFDLLKNKKMPFYIDRLQGGCYIEKYPYDKRLLQKYKDMLGELFWGFQMHEWMSNYRSDLNKLQKFGCPAWDADSITKTIFKGYPFKHLFLEAMDAEEMASLGKPESYEDFLRHTEWLFRERQRYTDGLLIPCDSAYLSHSIELKNGAKRIMSEIGDQTRNTRVQVAYARGMSKAYGVPFGTYYEPWGGSPFSSCCYHKDGKNEWNIGEKDFPYKTNGANGGSSRSLQRRLHLYSYFSGASFMSEEWGLCNTFYDWEDFELSPYGKIKLDFIRFTEKYSNVGTPVTPIAVVLPKELAVLEGLHKDEDTLTGFEIKAPLYNKVKAVREGIRKLFCTYDEHLGTEKPSLANCKLPDALDIVNEDKFNENDYEYLVDLTSSPEFANKYAKRICDIDDVAMLLDKLLPCTFEGSAMKQLTKLSDSSYYLLLTNNSGVKRTVEEGEILLKEADSTVKVLPKEPFSLSMLEGTAEMSRADDGTYTVNIGAGGWFLGRLTK